MHETKRGSLVLRLLLPYYYSVPYGLHELKGKWFFSISGDLIKWSERWRCKTGLKGYFRKIDFELNLTFPAWWHGKAMSTFYSFFNFYGIFPLPF